MATDKNYYLGKQQKLNQKLTKIKDQYIVDSLNMAQRLANEIQEIQTDNQEINKIIQEQEKEEEVKVKINKK